MEAGSKGGQGHHKTLETRLPNEFRSHLSRAAELKGACMYQAVIPEDPRLPDPSERPPPSPNPDAPPPIEEPAEPGIPL